MKSELKKTIKKIIGKDDPPEKNTKLKYTYKGYKITMIEAPHGMYYYTSIVESPEGKKSEGEANDQEEALRAAIYEAKVPKADIMKMLLYILH